MKKIATLIIISIVYFSCTGQNKYSEWFDLNLKNQPTIIIEFNYYPLTELSEDQFSFYMDSSVNYLTERKVFFYDTLGFITKGNIKHSMEYEIIELSGYQHERHFYKDSIIITLPSARHSHPIDGVNLKRLYRSRSDSSRREWVAPQRVHGRVDQE